MEKQTLIFPCFHYNRQIVWKQKQSQIQTRSQIKADGPGSSGAALSSLRLSFSEKNSAGQRLYEHLAVHGWFKVTFIAQIFLASRKTFLSESYFLMRIYI